MPNIGTRANWPFPTAPGLGVSVEELKIQQARPDKDPALMPIAQTAPVEFISPTSSSEHLRLQTPVAANPLATPTGPLHDHIYIRRAFERAESELSQRLYQLVVRDGVQLPADRKSQIRASLSREQALFSRLREVKDMQEYIYGKIVGTAEA
jgi:hypothetical protein